MRDCDWRIVQRARFRSTARVDCPSLRRTRSDERDGRSRGCRRLSCTVGYGADSGGGASSRRARRRDPGRGAVAARVLRATWATARVARRTRCRDGPALPPAREGPATTADRHPGFPNRRSHNRRLGPRPRSRRTPRRCPDERCRDLSKRIPYAIRTASGRAAGFNLARATTNRTVDGSFRKPKECGRKQSGSEAPEARKSLSLRRKPWVTAPRSGRAPQGRHNSFRCV